MARLMTRTPTAATHWQRKVGSLITLIAVPTIWAVLLVSLMRLSVKATIRAIGLAGATGLFAGIEHEFYSGGALPLPQQG